MKIDVVMLVNSKDPRLIEMTQRAIDSLHQSETEHEFVVQLMESNKSSKHQYTGCTQHYPEAEFNYNGYMLEGIGKSTNEWVVMANNDLIFHKGWFSGILEVAERLPEVKSFSSFTPSFLNKLPDPYYVEYGIGVYITGWCITAKREIFDIINLDTRVNFWFSDNIYQDELIKHNIKHALVRNSLVTHLTSQTLFTMGEKVGELTHGQAEYYYKGEK